MNHFIFFATETPESDILGEENDNKSEGFIDSIFDVLYAE
jgi:hypothetical protein